MSLRVLAGVHPTFLVFAEPRLEAFRFRAVLGEPECLRCALRQESGVRLARPILAVLFDLGMNALANAGFQRGVGEEARQRLVLILWHMVCFLRSSGA